jgi:hypothetical protein
MSVVQCLACQHESPATAKFCSDCGGQLNLTLCQQCEAINERAWQRCYDCGAELITQLGVYPPFSSLVPVTSKPSAARRMRTWRTLVSVLAFATIAGLAVYVYTQPNLNGDQMRVGGLPAPSATRVEAAAAPVDVSTAKTQASVVPVTTSKQRVTKADHIASPASARSFNKKESAATIASDVPKANIEYPPAGTTAAASGASSARPPKPQPAEPTVGSARPGLPNDFHFIAPPP